MAAMNPQVENELRQGFKYVNRFMLFMWRLGLGQWINIWPDGIGRIMVIVHTGRKTHMVRRTPVNYAMVDGELYCVAGFGHRADWYQNILHNSQVEVWLPDGWWAGVAEEVTDSKLRLPLIRAVLVASGFAGRMAGFTPEMSNEALDSLTADYRLVRIQRTCGCTGAGGPGELAWVWPLSVMLMAVVWLLRPRGR